MAGKDRLISGSAGRLGTGAKTAARLVRSALGLFAIAMCLIAVGGMWLIDSQPLPTRMLFAGMTVIADQIYTTIQHSNGHKERYSLYATMAFLTMIYLPPWQAIESLIAASLIGAVIDHFEWYKRLYNVLSMSISVIALVGTYTFLIDIYDAKWPAIQVIMSLFIAGIVYELVSFGLLTIPMRAVAKETWANIYNLWTKTIFFPFGSAVAAVVISLGVDYTVWAIPLIAVAITAFLQPVYYVGKRGANYS